MKPYSETLLTMVVDKLKLISTTEGYSFTMKSAERFDRQDLTTFEKPCAHVYRISEDKERSGSAWSCLLDVVILVYLFEHETLNTTTEEFEAEVGGDVEYALTQMELLDDFRAMYVSMGSVLFSSGDEEQIGDVGVAITATLGYRVDFWNPGVPIDPE